MIKNTEGDTMSNKSIESLNKDQKKLVNERTNIEAQIEALKQKLDANKKAEKNLKKAKKDAISAERAKNKNARTRNLIKLAAEVLNLFPDLKKQFEDSVSKSDYDRSGKIMRNEILSFIMAKKESQNPAPTPERVINQTPAIHGESVPVAPIKEESQSPDPYCESATAPAVSNSHEFYFEKYNRKDNYEPPVDGPMNKSEVQGKVCPWCGAQAIQAENRYTHKLYYFCANSAYWEFGNKNCEFQTYKLDELKDADKK